MKTYSCNGLTLFAVAVALASPGHTLLRAQVGGVPLWANLYVAGQVGGQPNALALDGSGNVFVTGFTTSSSFTFEYATIKYSSAGTALWTNYYNGLPNGSAQAYALAVDVTGNVLVTGQAYDSAFVNSDYATIKYSGAGVPLWTNRYHGPGIGFNSASAVAVDGSGNVFVTGYSVDTNSLDDYTTIKYSGAGTPLWTNRYNGSGNSTDQAFALAVDGSGNVFVTGNSYNTNTYNDFVTIKYSSAGVPLWTNRYNGPGNSDDVAQALALDGTGNVFITGRSTNTRGDYDYVTIKYSSAGVPLWTKRYDGPGNSTDIPNAIRADANGNVYVTGRSYGTNGGFDYATIKYSGTGVPLWTNRFDGRGNIYNEGRAVAVDGAGNVFVTGSCGSGETAACETIAYSGAGVPLWTNWFRPQDGSGTAVLVDGSGNVLVTGSYFIPDGTGYVWATLKYSSAIPPSLTLALTTTNTLAVSWPSPSTGFTLQQNASSLSSVTWSNVLDTPSDDGTTRSVIVAPPTGTWFYRLVHP